ncbi:MAG TPA: hypothetical protein VF736_06740 [Pyrinomonadaceae bacterium]
MGFIRNRYLGLVFCVGLLACVPAAEAREGTRAEAERLWELAVAAKGGRERLYAVHSLLVASGSQKYPLIQLYAFSGRFWQWAHDPEPLGLAVQMYDAARPVAYLSYPDDPESPRRLGGDVRATANYVLAEAQMYYLLETRWLKPEPFETFAGEVGGRRADVVRARVAGRQADFYLDRKTRLPVQVVFPSEGAGYHPFVRMKDYADVGGVMLPSKVGHEGDARGRYVYALNPDYDPGVFERPPTIEAGPFAWRRAAAR